MKIQTATQDYTQVEGATQFTIAATGKAFKSLIDNLYTDKVTTPVRELMTNAFDSHVDAGKGNEPFTVIVPTTADPRFGVRDFGTGMTHEMVTTLYTTLFGSSKEDTNEQVGQLGLGSKSPFAYADAFTVTTFDGLNKRIYSAFITGDMPALALTDTVPSNAPTGVLVEFPVDVAHVYAFASAIGKVAMGFDVQPIVLGGEVTVPKPSHSGKGWKAYDNRSGLSHGLYVRQGCVIYPVREHLDGPSFPVHGYDALAVVVDVPVGDAQVALSREALSWDQTTAANVSAAATAAWEDASSTLTEAYDAIDTQVAKFDYRNKFIPRSWWEALNIPMGHEVTLFPRSFDGAARTAHADTPGYYVMLAQPTKKWGVSTTKRHSYDHNELGSVRIVLMDETTKRAKGRIRQWVSNSVGYRKHQYAWLPVSGQAAAVARITKEWGLRPEQFIPVDYLDDLDTASTPATASKATRTVLDSLQDKLDNGAIWVEVHRNKMQPVVPLFQQNYANTLTLDSELPHLVAEVVGDTEVLRLNAAQKSKLKTNQRNELSNRVGALAVTYFKDVQRMNTNIAKRQALRESFIHEAQAALTPVLLPFDSGMHPAVNREVHTVAQALGRVADIKEVTHVVDSFIRKAQDRYPMVRRLDRSEVDEYIAQMTAEAAQ